MLYVYNSNKTLFKYSKLRVSNFSPHIWRLMYLIHSNNVYNALTKKIQNGSTTIPTLFLNYEIFVYSGLKWLSRVVSKWSVGFKTGSLTWNRKRALYKSKQVKKKT